MTIGVNIAERLSDHPFMSQAFVHRTAVAPMALDADIHAGMTCMPFALVGHRVFLGITGGA